MATQDLQLAERLRAAAVRSMAMPERGTDANLNDAVLLAAAICGVPISLVTVLNGETQVFMAKTGIEADGTPQQHAFCAHTIQQSGVMIVADAEQDIRFRDNPLVTGNPHIRFYAGVPLRSTEGAMVGSLCVIDTVPRSLTLQQQNALTMLSRQVEAVFELYDQNRKLTEALAEKDLAQHALSSSNALFRAFMNNSPLATFMKDSDGRLIHYNRLFAERFNITEDAWIGKSDSEIWSPEFAAQDHARDAEALQTGQLSVTEDESPGPTATKTYWRTWKFPFTDAFGESFLAGMSLDITHEKQITAELARYNAKLKKSAERLAAISMVDSLTGIRNRRAFDERFEHEFAMVRRHNLPLSIALFDIDNFKSINDTLGHQEGDAVLRHVAEILQGGARQTDLVCRYGGEEFAIVLPNTSLESAAMVANRMCAAVAAAPIKSHRTTVSAGISSSREDSPDRRTLLREADLALYEAKSQGKNRVCLFKP